MPVAHDQEDRQMSGISPERRPRTIALVPSSTRRPAGRSRTDVGGGYQEGPRLFGVPAETPLCAHSLPAPKPPRLQRAPQFNGKRAQTGRRGRHADRSRGRKCDGKRRRHSLYGQSFVYLQYACDQRRGRNERPRRAIPRPRPSGSSYPRPRQPTRSRSAPFERTRCRAAASG